jgi:hypothetical protein
MKKVWSLLAVLAVFCSFAPAEEPETGEDPFGYVRKPLVTLPWDIGGDDDYMDITFGPGIGFIGRQFYFDGVLRMDYNVGPFTLTADLAMSNDQKYAPARVMNSTGNIGGIYFMLQEGGLSYNWKWIGLRGGRFRQYDIVDSPYSLFVNSLGHASNTLSINVDSPRFYYETRWIELNSRSRISTPGWNEYYRRYQHFGNYLHPDSSYFSAGGTVYPNGGIPYDPTLYPYKTGFPDRGVNYKMYALKFEHSRFGFLDATVYTGRSIDFEYFFNPIPQYFIQYVKGTPGRPWTTDSNENNLIGLFWDYTQPKLWDVYAQVLVDDFSLYFISNNFSANPWKAAWALGGRVHTRLGRFGFHHGGALKYTFEPITSPQPGYPYYDYGDISKTAYGYTYYPETQYYDDEDGGKTVSILIEDNMVGYKHGENNVAFQADYRNTFFNIIVNAELEFVLAGNNSPANPWQDYTHRSEMGKGTRILDDRQMEKHLEFRLNLSHRRGPWLFYGAVALGGRFNKLVLQRAEKPEETNWMDWSAADDQIYIWKASGEHEFIFRFSLGFKYTLPVL